MRILKTVLVASGLLSALAGTAQSTAFKLNGHELELPAPILFEKGTATLTPSSTPALQHIKDYLANKTYISVLRIEGHASEQALSEQRALAVSRWLVKNGVDCHRLIAVGFGKNKPAVAASYADGAGNARIVVANAALGGRAIGGMPLDAGGVLAGDLCE